MHNNVCSVKSVDTVLRENSGQPWNVNFVKYVERRIVSYFGTNNLT